MPKNTGYAWTGAGLIKRSEIKSKKLKPLVDPPMAPGIKTDLALKRKNKGKR